METLLKKIQGLLSKGKSPVVIGIDGNCCSGKSTLAASLSSELDCCIFHADDFFLRPEQRTPERLGQPGGNLDRERLMAQVLQPLHRGDRAIYEPFSCRSMSLLPLLSPTKKRLNIVEGAYCLHPDLWDLYDLRVFLTAPWDVRLERLKKREGGKIDVFLQRWIPMEDEYFRVFDIKNRVDIVLADK
jgi:uridine kinase